MAVILACYLLSKEETILLTASNPATLDRYGGKSAMMCSREVNECPVDKEECVFLIVYTLEEREFRNYD